MPSCTPPAAADRLWVGVTGTGPGHPIPQRPTAIDEHGRGLQLVGSLADRWGVRRRRETQEKTVWFELTGAPTTARPEHPVRPEPEPSG